MIINDSLRLEPGIIAVIGSGGKTSLIECLAKELSHGLSNGKEAASLICCTTTRIMIPSSMNVLYSLDYKLQKGQVVCVGQVAEENSEKLAEPRQSIEELACFSDYVMVEADGSKHLPIKAHKSSEPVIPKGTKTIIVLVGLSGLGKPVNEVVHRPDIFINNTGCNEGDIVSPELIAKNLVYERLIFSRASEKWAGQMPVRWIYIVNQCDINYHSGQQLAEEIKDEFLRADIQQEVYVMSLLSNNIAKI